MRKLRSKLLAGSLAFLLLLPVGQAAANNFTVTPGVDYKKGAAIWNGQPQSIHSVEVDIGRPDVSVQAIIPDPLQELRPLTYILNKASTQQMHAVAGVNASFFHTTGKNAKSPAYLLAANNKVNTYGVISTGNDEYMSVPSAFGVDKNGRGQIGKFGYEASIKVGDEAYKISSINKERGSSEVILYTPSYSFETTRTNEIGMEISLDNLSTSIEEGYELGTEVTATVSKIATYSQGGNSVIPKKGAVISIQGGTQAAAFSNVKEGDKITLSIDLTNPWKSAEYVLASGPLLVQNGKVDMTINPNSSRAKTRHPRTAVAVNKDRTKVFLVTVDGRKTNSRGMTLSEFSNYLVSIGAHDALNLDGGGSTTMAVQKPGQSFPGVMNSPSGNFERYISAVLGAVTYPEYQREGVQWLNSFENKAQWKSSSANAQTELRFDGEKSPLKDGQTSLTLTYDFTKNLTGTSASYAVANPALPMAGKPTALGLWVYGDGAGHWLRGTIVDRNGKEHTIDFTKESGLTWKGWKYVKAPIPTAAEGPIWLKQIYVVETASHKKNKGSIYFDRLLAEYGTTHQEQPFNDVPLSYWAIDEVQNAVEKEWINGYPNGTFGPGNYLTRAHAAVLLTRALNLPIPSTTSNLFEDVSEKHIYAKEIAAIQKAGIMSGKENGRFDPDAPLTRAQMAKILVAAYKLDSKGEVVPPLLDVNEGFWAYDDIQILQENHVTIVSDHRYRPNEFVNRAQFATFMTRAHR